MAQSVKPFSPFFLQKFPGANRDEIVDRNLLAIQQALDQANVTIQKQQTIINRIIAGDINISITTTPGPQGPPGTDAEAGDGGGDTFVMAGQRGPRGLQGLGVPGQDAEDPEPPMPGLPGRPGRDGASGIWLPGADEDGVEAPPLMVPGAVQSDSVSFHFYQAYTSGPTGLSGYLSPADLAPVTPLAGAVGIDYLPSVQRVYRRGELLIWIMLNNLAGVETCNLQVTKNGAAIAASSATFTSGSSGFIYAQFLTGSTAALDRYAVLVSNNGNTRYLEHSVVLRLFEA